MIRSEHKNASIIKLGLVILATVITTSFNINNNPKVTNLSLNKTIPLATEISNNEATGNGGGIANNGELIIEDGKVNENIANNGGGLYNSGESTLLGGEIADNEALQDGGGVYSTNTGIVNTSEAMLITGPELNTLIADDVNLIVFSDITAPADASLTDVSMLQDGSIVAWTTDDGTMTISTQKKNAKVYANPDSSFMFANKDSIQAFDFSNLDMRYVTTMQRAFEGTSAPYIDISNFNTINCVDFQGLFLSAHEVKEINVTNLDLKSAKNIRFMFAGNGSADEETMYLENIIGEETLRPANCENFQSVFNNCRYLQSLDLTDWIVENGTSFRSCFYNLYNATEIKVDGWTTPNAEDIRWMFYYCKAVNKLDTSGIVVDKCSSLKSVFAGCENVEYLDVGDWVTDNITEMNFVFNRCLKLKNISVKNWNMQNVETVASMFNFCNSLESLDISGWQTSKCKSFRTFFQNGNPNGGYSGKDISHCTYLNIDGIDTSACEDFGWTFYGLANLTYLDVSSLNTSNCKNFHHMFSGCGSLVISGYEDWDISKAEYLNATFHSLANEYFDVSKFDTSNCKSFAQMFEYCVNLKRIDGLENFNTSNGEHFYQMFGNSPQLTELNLISFDTTKANDTFIDEQRGYTSDCMLEMFHNLIYLERITLGEKFSFNGNGNDCITPAVLPTPLGENITGADGHWYNEVTFEQYEPTEVPSLVEATYIVVNPKANLEIFENPDGSTGGVYEPPADEPAEIPEIPEENLPELIEFEFGEFKAVTEYTPGTYEDVEYTYTYTRDIYPVSYQSIVWSQWMITKDSEGNIINTEPYEITLDVIDKTYSNYIVYNFETSEALYENGVAGDSVQLYTIYNSDVDNVENAIYLAAYLNKQEGTTNNHVAHLVDEIYVDAGLDTQVSEIDKFTETYTQTYTKQVMVEAPSSSTSYVYIPISNMKAEKGMTWEQWLVSEYNTTGITENVKIMTSDYIEVALDSEIDPTKSYGFRAEIYELQGLWMFNKTIQLPEEEIIQAINFIFNGNGEECCQLKINTSLIVADYIETDTAGSKCTTLYFDDGFTWSRETATLNFSNTQPVSKEFYEWFITNAQPCLSGTYKWNDSIELPENNLEQQLYFNDESRAIEKIIVSDYALTYFDDDNDPIVVYYTGAGFSLHSTIMQFGDVNQPVSLEFYKWFMANATSYIEPGLYAADGTMTYSWQELIDNKVIHVTDGVFTTNANISDAENGSYEILEGKLVIDSSITMLGDYALFACWKLTDIILPNNLTEIGDCAFQACAFNSINIPASVTTIGSNAFYHSRLNNIIIPGNVKDIGAGAFSYCIELEIVYLEYGVESIGMQLFANIQKPINVYIPSSVETIPSEYYYQSLFYASANATVYCQFDESEIPSGWGTYWNDNALNTLYNITPEEFKALTAK